MTFLAGLRASTARPCFPPEVERLLCGTREPVRNYGVTSSGTDDTCLKSHEPDSGEPMQYLPPVAALIAFDLAARHLSFQKAADVLCITPSAVSHRVKALEQFVGVKLFHRLNRRILLTDAGQNYARSVRDALQRLEKSTRQLLQNGKMGSVTIQLPPSLATKWLLPRLRYFLEAHPGFEVKLNATEGPVFFERSSVDLAICHLAPKGDLHVEELIAERFTPLCAPAKWVATPADLVRFPLIKTERNPVSWDEWLQGNGIDHFDMRSSLQLDPSSAAIQAAVAGLGIILESDFLVQDELANGQLICPFQDGVVHPIIRHYYLSYPRAAADDPKIQLLASWLRSIAVPRKAQVVGEDVDLDVTNTP